MEHSLAYQLLANPKALSTLPFPLALEGFLYGGFNPRRRSQYLIMTHTLRHTLIYASAILNPTCLIALGPSGSSDIKTLVLNRCLMHTHTHIHTYIYIDIHICICMYMDQNSF